MKNQSNIVNDLIKFAEKKDQEHFARHINIELCNEIIGRFMSDSFTVCAVSSNTDGLNAWAENELRRGQKRVLACYILADGVCFNMLNGQDKTVHLLNFENRKYTEVFIPLDD